jgi:hypothetical protein
VFEKAGTLKFQFGIPGEQMGQLRYPRKVAVMRNSGKFVVCDRANDCSRMQIFTKNGRFFKNIIIRWVVTVVTVLLSVLLCETKIPHLKLDIHNAQNIYMYIYNAQYVYIYIYTHTHIALYIYTHT